MDDVSQFDFRPTATLESLKARAELLQRIHAFFQTRDFIHVETPLVSRDTVVDRHIEPVTLKRSAFHPGNLFADSNVFLQTSPEFAMKRLLAAGANAIYQICKAFRQGESGSRHNPEFTMLEWYRTGDDYQSGIDLLADFAEAVLGRGRPKTITYRQAFLDHANVDPFSASIPQLIQACQSNNVPYEPGDAPERADLLNVLLSEVIEPNISTTLPHIIFDWPADQAALAKTRTNEQGIEVAERFELYAQGLELANGYHELLDADELQRRTTQVNQQRIDDGKPGLPSGSHLLSAMRHGLPGCSGVAVGVDRLAMVVLEKNSIDEVIAFPFSKA